MPRPAETSLAARAFGALSDPVRWRAIELLSHGERCVCDLEAEIGAAQSRLSYHLSVLREAGLVHTRREGRWVYYALAPDALEQLAEELRGVTEAWRGSGASANPARCD